MSGLYNNYKAQVLGGGVHPFPNLVTGTIHCGIVSGADYAENLTTDQDWDDVGTYTIGACYNAEATQPLANKTTTDGVFGNSDVNLTFLAVAIDGVKDVDALVHFVLSGVITTDSLICFHDGFTPVTPNGGDIVVAHHASGIFAI